MFSCLVVWLFGCLVVWLFSCLVVWLFGCWLFGCIQTANKTNNKKRKKTLPHHAPTTRRKPSPWRPPRPWQCPRRMAGRVSRTCEVCSAPPPLPPVSPALFCVFLCFVFLKIAVLDSSCHFPSHACACVRVLACNSAASAGFA